MTDIVNSGTIRLRVEGRDKKIVEYAIQSVSVSYSINQIPLATCVLNTGVSLREDRLALPHTARGAAAFDEMNRAWIVMTAAGPYSPSAKRTWDDVGEVVLIEGRISGVSPTLSRTAMSAEVSIIHWLGDLAFSAALSEQAGHGSHSSLRMQAIFQSPGDSTGQNMPAFIHDFGLAEHLTPEKLADDLWGSAIHPALLALTKHDPLTVESMDAKCVVQPDDTGNQILREALSRFDGDKKDGRNPRSKQYVAMRTNAGALVTDGIRQYVTRVFNESLGGRSMWEKLLEITGPLGLAVIPLVDHAMVVPLTLGLRSTFVKKLRLSDISMMKPERWTVRPIRSSVILSGRVASATAFAAAAAGSENQTLDRSSLIGGCFVPENGPGRGQVLVGEAPVWLDQIPAMANSASRTVGSNDREVGSTTGKAGKNEDLRGNKDGKTPADAVQDVYQLYKDYARYQYVTEVLKNRSLVVSCPTFRMDIAPGSSVEIEGPFNEPLFGGKMFGTVIRVTLFAQVSRDQIRLGTQLRLAGIRREEENSGDVFSVDDHPLYAGARFTGTPLQDKLLFEDK